MCNDIQANDFDPNTDDTILNGGQFLVDHFDLTCFVYNGQSCSYYLLVSYVL